MWGKAISIGGRRGKFGRIRAESYPLNGGFGEEQSGERVGALAGTSSLERCRRLGS